MDSSHRTFGPKPRPPEERFWPKVDKTAEGGCWLWTASKTGPGYGQFGVAQGNIVLAHRYAYEQVVGPIPEGLTLDHLCRNRACVNPAHLEPVTLVENLRRGTSPAAENGRKTHCIRGHPLFGENVYLDPRGRRQCRECRREADNQFRRRLEEGAVVERSKLPCQVCGRLLAVRSDGLTRRHKANKHARNADACQGTGYRHDRWPVGQLLRHHSGGIWEVIEDRGGEYGNYVIRCPNGQRSIWRDEWLEEPGKTIVAHGEYMHRHGWTPISDSVTTLREVKSA